MSLNESQGGYISDLELTLRAIRKLLNNKIDSNPKAGLVLAKGKPNEARLHYKDMADVLSSLEEKLSLQGCFSFGVCKTCDRFNPKTSATGHLGTCGGKVVHEYDSCEKHSQRGGGYGL